MKITASAPVRIGILGGGTDTSPFCDLYGGLVLSLAVNIRQQVTITDKGKEKFIKGDSPEFFKAFLGYPVKIEHKFDCPIESGLGSSASLGVCLVGIMNKLNNMRLTKDEIALRAWDIEVNKLGKFGGKQDQFMATFGGCNLMRFGKGDVEVISLPKRYVNKLSKWLLLFHSGENRKSGKIQEGLKELNFNQELSLIELKHVCWEGNEALLKGDINKVGELLDFSWVLKKSSNAGVTNKRIDKLYSISKQNGALGFKISGAGGGGCFIVIAPPKAHKGLINALKDVKCKHIPFKVDWKGLSVK
jgi:D-glycero-alpha-D-manno-heptose-7-phosphate kinase